jgi:hypothetical protein
VVGFAISAPRVSDYKFLCTGYSNHLSLECNGFDTPFPGDHDGVVGLPAEYALWVNVKNAIWSELLKVAVEIYPKMMQLC